MQHEHDDDIFATDEDNTEFHFDDDASDVEETVASDENKNGNNLIEQLKEKVQGNVLYIVIMGVVIIFALYLLSGIFTKPSHKQQAAVPNTHFTQVVRKPVQQVEHNGVQNQRYLQPGQTDYNQAATQQNINKQQQQTMGVVPQTQQNNSRFDALEKQLGVYQQKISDLQQQSAQNQTQIKQLRNTIMQMNNTIEQLAIELSKQHAAAAKPKPVAAKKTHSNLSYYVQALIPGRAWLKGSNGATMTVAPGDVVPGYGRVLRINPNNGTVTTTSGTTLRFGISEN